MLTKFPRAVVGFIFLASMVLSGCQGWRAQTNPTPGAQLANPARVTRTDGSVVVMRDAAVSRDSVAGTGEAGRVAIPLSEVRSIEARRMDGGRTALLTVGILAGLLGLVVLAASNVPPSYGEF